MLKYALLPKSINFSFTLSEVCLWVLQLKKQDSVFGCKNGLNIVCARWTRCPFKELLLHRVLLFLFRVELKTVFMLNVVFWAQLIWLQPLKRDIFGLSCHSMQPGGFIKAEQQKPFGVKSNCAFSHDWADLLKGCLETDQDAVTPSRNPTCC